MSRIIAGRYGGRRLSVPAGDRTRPTTDRVREALFATITSWVGDPEADEPLRGLAFLDLYAGSGAVGLEAASRGADPVLLVEADQRTVRTVIKPNIAALSAPVTVRTARVEQLLAGPALRAYDVVFVDPPYDLDAATVDRQLVELVTHGWVGEGGLIIVERSRRSREVTAPQPLTDVTIRRYGETTLTLLRVPARETSVTASVDSPERQTEVED